ncbi:hypothetical protein N9459_02855 [Flavobacteriaceae bacterium]|nr:hypothetical protein [Flavobacteriaceae bacterium]
MPEVKNIFVGAKMNKDLNPRMISNQEYIDARNAAIINSEGSDSGLLQNVSGNTLLTDFGLTGINLEIIGFYIDPTKNILYSFITDWNDTSPDQSSRFAPSTSSHYICAYNTSTNNGTVLVSGSFLNFSKTSPMLGINLLEDLLFFTDNRNQPRKINVVTAGLNATYYTKEHHISVAKYYPWKPMRLAKYTPVANPYALLVNSLLTVSLQPLAITDGTYSGTVGAGGWTSNFGTGALIEFQANGNVISDVKVLSSGSLFTPDVSIITVASGTYAGQTSDIKFTVSSENIDQESTMKDVVSENLPITEVVTASGGITTTTFDYSESAINTNWEGSTITATESDGVTPRIKVSDNIKITNISGNTITHDTFSGLVVGDIITVGANPYYDEFFDGDSEFLSDKFARFSYRFKYSDGEYSLIAPFTQPAFIPKQDGYFLDELIVPLNVNDEVNISDENRAIKSTIVSFFENKVNSMELVIDKPSLVSSFSEIIEDLKVSEIDILYKQSDQVAIKVIDTISSQDIITFDGLQYLYKYKSAAPIKTLPSNETTRASDKVPITAKAQEIAGNRVIYGNYLVRTSRPTSLGYSVSSSEKFKKGVLNSVNQIEYPNHSLKQNRSYKVGIVLVDYFGRQSDVIASKNSTIYSSYRNVGDGVIGVTSSYMGDSLKILWDSVIPNEKEGGYAGIYSESNPLGWYSYKVVVQQQEQDYYNVYLPTILNNYPQDGGTTTSNDTAFITLFSDNINKVPRDLKEVGPQQLQFSSSVNLFARVTNTTFSDTLSTTKQYQPSTSPDTVTLIGTRDDIGVNLKIDGTNYNISPFFSVPEVYVPGNNTSDPIVPPVKNVGSNPYIAKVATQDRVGAIGATATTVTFENTRLNVYETEPFESNLDIFWETSSSGVISDLNKNIISSSNINQPFAISNWVWSFLESDAPGTYVTEPFDVVNSAGLPLASSGTVTAKLINVSTPSNAEVGGIFELEQEASPSYKWRIKLLNPQVFVSSSALQSGNWSFTIEFTNTVAGEIFTETITNSGNNILENVTPTSFQAFGISNKNKELLLESPGTPFTPFTYLAGSTPLAAPFQFKNGTYSSVLLGSIEQDIELVVTPSKVEVFSLYLATPDNPPIPGGYISYKPLEPISSYMRVTKYQEDLFGTPIGYRYNLEYNKNFTCINQFARTESDFYDYSKRQDTQFRITINIKDAAGGTGFEDINIIVQGPSGGAFYLEKNPNNS